MLYNPPPMPGMLGQRPVQGMLATPIEQDQSLGVNLSQPQQGSLGNQASQALQPGHMGSISQPRQATPQIGVPTPQVQPSFTPMKTGQPAGYAPPTANSQAISGLSSPGWQSQLPSIGGPSPSGFSNTGVRPSGAVSGPAAPTVAPNFGAPSGAGAAPGPAGGSAPPGTTPSNMNQWSNSSNMSTLLRTLVGNTTTPGA